jgi:hypothetical protein
MGGQSYGSYGMSCLMSSNAALFTYMYKNKSKVEYGTRDEATGVCIATGASDCDSGADANSMLFTIVMVIAFAIGIRLMKKNMAAAVSPDFKIEGFVSKSMGQLSSCGQALAIVAVVAYEMTQLLVSVMMSESIQTTLSVSAKNVELAAGVFLPPVEEIFAFLEDTVTVRVNYAIRSKQYKELRTILKWGFWGGLFWGTVAAGIVTAIIYSPTFDVVTNPTAAGDVMLFPDCIGAYKGLPDTKNVAAQSKEYWLLTVWEWPFQFAVKPVHGFFFGSMKIFPLAFASVMDELFILPWWFIGRHTASNKLTWLGWGGFFGSMIAILFYFAYFVWAKDFREKYGLFLYSNEFGKRNEDDAEDGAKDSNLLLADESAVGSVDGKFNLRKRMAKNKVGMGLIREGIHVMVLDLALQLSITIATYVAMSHGSSVAYKLSIAESIMGVLATPYTAIPVMLVKIFCAQMLAGREFRAFEAAAHWLLLITLALAAGAYVTLMLYTDSWVQDYAGSSCTFAMSHGCAPLYRNLFDGLGADVGAVEVVQKIGITITCECVFMISRAIVVSMCDFKFLAKTAVATLLFAFTPAIIIVHSNWPTSALAYLLAMRLPHAAMAVVFYLRIRSNIAKMKAGEDGPWSTHATAEIRQQASARSSEQLDDAQQQSEEMSMHDSGYSELNEQ